MRRTDLLKFLFFVVLVFLITLQEASPVCADAEQDRGLWLMVASQGSFDQESPKLSRLRWWFDGHARFFNETDGYGQSIVRPGVGWAVTEGSTLWLGYGWIRNSPAQGPDVDENRIWQQWTTGFSLGKAGLGWRSRLEQRFLEGSSDVGWRFRQFIKLTRPLAFDDRLRLVAYDEIFLALNDTDWGANAGFDQNRFFVGLSWQFVPGRSVELGYLNQYIQRSGQDNLVNNILSMNLLVNF
jgi:hypothetical protein